METIRTDLQDLIWSSTEHLESCLTGGTGMLPKIGNPIFHSGPKQNEYKLSYIPDVPVASTLTTDRDQRTYGQAQECE